MASLAYTFWKSPFLQILRTVSWSNTLDFWRRTEEMPANSWNRPPIRATKKGNEMYWVWQYDLTNLGLHQVTPLVIETSEALSRWHSCLLRKPSWRVNRKPLQLPIKLYQIHPRVFCCVWQPQSTIANWSLSEFSLRNGVASENYRTVGLCICSHCSQYDIISKYWYTPLFACVSWFLAVGLTKY